MSTKKNFQRFTSSWSARPSANEREKLMSSSTAKIFCFSQLQEKSHEWVNTERKKPVRAYFLLHVTSFKWKNSLCMISRDHFHSWNAAFVLSRGHLQLDHRSRLINFRSHQRLQLRYAIGNCGVRVCWAGRFTQKTFQFSYFSAFEVKVFLFYERIFAVYMQTEILLSISCWTELKNLMILFCEEEKKLISELITKIQKSTENF